MNCSHCNTPNPGQARFCLNCGAQLALACPQCGAGLPSQARFCFACGAQLAAAPAAGPPQAVDERLKRLVPREFVDRLLATRGQVESERRLVTILFSDVKGSTAMAEKLDPEDVMEIMNGAFDVLIEPIYRHEGTLARLMGDAILAFFGAPISHEDDAERACRAALDIVAGAQTYAASLERERGLAGFNVRVGLNTGLVVVGEVGSDLRVEYTAMGDAINLAARMEQNAPAGGVLISQQTYQHVRGAFEVQALEPLAVKGKAEPVQVYLLQRARPRAFRMATRGVEGVETRLVGREAELLILQGYFHDVVQDVETRAVTLVGDAGVGKSRLLYEFENWLAQRPEDVFYFKGRASSETQAVPYGILRDAFAARFEIRETDSAAQALDKFRAGLASSLPPHKADLLGHMIGFDFSASPAVRSRLGSESFKQLATTYLFDYMQALAGSRPLVVFLEDIHWADDASLDLVDRLIAELPDAHLLIVCLARPALFERRPQWGEGRDAYARLELKPLSKRDSRTLVTDILHRVADVPPDLRDRIVGGAEGNPYYIEELIRMFIDGGVIVRGQGELDPWRIDLERLAGIHVPPTLAGVLQARLDSLPLEEKHILQRASVVGREFWDVVVARLAGGAGDVAPFLDSLRQRGLVFCRERSAFQGASEYVFKHTTLRDVTYESVLLKLRRAYHAQVAAWLEENAGERLGEYVSLIAHHYELAGETARAIAYLRRAGQAALRAGAGHHAIDALKRALALAPPGDQALQAGLRVQLGGAYVWMTDIALAAPLVEQGLELARGADDWQMALQALLHLTTIAEIRGEFVEEGHWAEQAVALARQRGERADVARALLSQGDAARTRGEYKLVERCYTDSLALYRELGDGKGTAGCLGRLGGVAAELKAHEHAWQYYEQSLAVYKEMGDQVGVSESLLALGRLAMNLGKHDRARVCFEDSLEISRELGGLDGICNSLFYLGSLAREQGEFDEAERHFQECLLLNRRIGAPMAIASVHFNLGRVALARGDLDAARRYYRTVSAEMAALGTVLFVPAVVIEAAKILLRLGQAERAAEVLGLAQAHPAAEGHILALAEPLLDGLRQALPAGQLEAALRRGKTLALDEILAQVLGQDQPEALA